MGPAATEDPLKLGLYEDCHSSSVLAYLVQSFGPNCFHQLPNPDQLNSAQPNSTQLSSPLFNTGQLNITSPSLRSLLPFLLVLGSGPWLWTLRVHGVFNLPQPASVFVAAKTGQAVLERRRAQASTSTSAMPTRSDLFQTTQCSSPQLTSTHSGQPRFITSQFVSCHLTLLSSPHLILV